MSYKLKRTEAEIAEAAERGYSKAWAEHEAKFGKSDQRSRLQGVAPDKLRPHCWTALFEITTLTGSPVDGPAIVLVDDLTLQVQILEATVKMFGSHLSIAGGMHLALLAAEGYGMETVQVFTKNQQQWKAKPLEEGVIREFRNHAERLGYGHVVSHDSYLINLAAKEDFLWERSIEAFVDEMQRCDLLGIPYLVTHPGAHVGSGEEAGIARIVAGLTRILQKEEKGKVTVCLETTAGQGSTLGYRFEQLAEMIDGVEKAGFGDRVAVCVDTCHILAAGYDITTAAGTRAVLEEMDRVIGLKRVKAWHLNDSKKALGTQVDRHEHIGRGFVGMEAFGVICADERMKGVPKIMETPKDAAPDGRDWDVVNLELLRGLAAGKKMQLLQFETGELKHEGTKARSNTKKAELVG